MSKLVASPKKKPTPTKPGSPNKLLTPKQSPTKEGTSTEVFDYGDSMAASDSKPIAPIGKQYYERDPKYYRFPIVLECSIVSREHFSSNHNRI